MKERCRHKLPHPVHLGPGDKLICSVTERGETHQFTEKIGRKVIVDTVVTFDADGDLGVAGIGAIFGQETEPYDVKVDMQWEAIP